MLLHVGPQDWGRCRFAVSPLQETTAALRLIRQVADGELLPTLPWELDAVTRACDLPLGPLLDLLPPRSWTPDVLNPPPLGPDEDLPTELARVVAVDPQRFAGEVDRCLRAHGRPVPDVNPARQQEHLVGLLELAWQQLVQPHWPRLHDLLAADVAVRAAAMAAGGLGAVLAELHPRVCLVGASILIGISHDGAVELDGRGLTLLPTAWRSGIGAMWDPPWQPAVTYPARGTHATPAAAHDALARLLGPTRARLLAALHVPATTSGLAARCDIPLSTVSDHLAVLRQAGLATAVRTGHAVQHTRSSLGDALVAVDEST